ALSVAFFLPLATLAQKAGGPPLPGNLRNNRMLSAWLRIEEGGKVRLLIGKVEIGQGILTAVQQICADHLDVDFSRIVITSGDTALSPREGVTAGSLSMPGCGMAVRQAAAEARQIFLDLAAKKLGASVVSLSVSDGAISAPGGGKTSYWELAGENPLQVEATGKVRPKAHGALRYSGKHVPRIDIPAKMTGGESFIQDMRLPGMLHGRVVHPPVWHAKLLGADLAVIEKMPGVVKAVRDGDFLGVVARREEQAIAAAEALRKVAQWEVSGKGPTSDTIYDWLQQQKITDLPIKSQAGQHGKKPAKVLKAAFLRPAQMHASIGPSCAIATFSQQGDVLVQTHSQSVFETRAALAMMLGVDVAKVRCQHVQGAGCYGHNGADDVTADAVLLARAVPGQPVRVQWMRHDEHKWEPFGSAMVMKLEAGLDADGSVLDWEYHLYSTAHSTRPSGWAGNLLAAQMLAKPFAQPVPRNGGGPNYAADRNAIADYDFPGHKVVTHFVENFAVRTSALRGLGAYTNVFAIESFMDDIAREAKADPVAYRLRYMKDERARAVLQKTADMFGWQNWKAAPGRGRGIAYARYKGSATYTAVAIEAEVDRTSGRIRVLRAASANDAGEIVAPDGVKNQIEGGIVQSLSWTLKEAVRFGPGGVLSEDWNSYPILTFSEVPAIEIELIDRPGAPFLGAGEASQGPTGAALANAVRDATGVRFHELPFTPARVLAGLKI
ncbi:MAG: xanthine dehydrogenase family protein molybdopterin-binding subunit, partial [Alphaproteobacteria bacterium]|nr:xanthine dehydrogenase family protein molybdopterin-binding subunit [Alphaproteobacteria bacterium]